MAKKKEQVESKESAGAKKNNSFKVNFWMIATIVLAVALLLFVAMGSFTTMSKKTASQKVISLANMSGLELTVLSVEDLGNFYGINYSIQNQSGVLDISKDGKYIGQLSAYPKSSASSASASSSSPSSAQQATVPKSDKPQVELYIWGYCPYGVQAQGPMAQVATLLKSSGATFEVVPYYDGHGAFETQEDKIELCIQKLYNDKYWSYAAGFVNNIYPVCSASRTVDCDTNQSAKLMKSLGIDSAKVMSCVSTNGDALFTAAATRAQQNNVQGSPTIIINGVTVNVARTADAIKSAVCGAFNNAPSTCSTALNSTAAAASGNCN